MKYLLIVLCFFNATQLNDVTITESIYISRYRDIIQYKELYDLTLEYIKKEEGFRSNWYDDRGYAAIGYGQRKLFFKQEITAPITKEQAHEILKESFDSHIEMINKVYPGLTKTEALAVAHMSYCIGIGKIKRGKLINNNKLNEQKLLKISGKRRREFEIELFKTKDLWQNRETLTRKTTF